MKRIIAVSLLIICIALPLISLSEYCTQCGHYNAHLEKKPDFVSIDSGRHFYDEYYNMVCPDCGAVVFDFRLRYLEDHVFQHYTQWVTATLTYEFNRCTRCGYIKDAHTVSH